MAISPSNLQRRAMCPGSEREEAAAPPSPSTDASERGTHLHWAIAKRLENPNQEMVLVPSAGYVFTDEDVEAIEFCVETVQEHIKDFKTRPRALMLVEHQLDMTGFGLNVEEDPDRCRLDFALVIPGDIALLFDWKFGVMPGVHPAYDWQFKAYALGLAQNYGVNTVQVARVQPALEADMRVRVAEFTADDLGAFGESILDIVSDTKEDDAPLSIGDHCQFCKAKAALSCPAMQRNATVIVPRGLSLGSYLESLDPTIRRDVFRRIRGAAKFFEAMKEQADAYVLNGGMVPGFHVGEGRKERAWRDEAAAETVLGGMLEAAGKDRESAAPKKVISPAQAEKLLGKSKAVKEKFEELVQINPGKPTVKEGDE